MFRAQIGEPKIWESKKQKLLGVEIDRTLSFDKHVVSFCRKDGKIVGLDYQISCVQIRAEF